MVKIHSLVSWPMDFTNDMYGSEIVTGYLLDPTNPIR